MCVFDQNNLDKHTRSQNIATRKTVRSKCLFYAAMTITMTMTMTTTTTATTTTVTATHTMEVRFPNILLDLWWGFIHEILALSPIAFKIRIMVVPFAK